MANWVCTDCGFDAGFAVAEGQRVHHNCGQAKPKRPGFARRVLNYAEAINRWRKAGSPQRSNEAVQAIFLLHCKDCERNVGGVCHHKTCGCRVSTGKHPLMNKIRMATESCPIGKWSADA